jgi:hypothetical protein
VLLAAVEVPAITVLTVSSPVFFFILKRKGGKNVLEFTLVLNL